MDEHEIFVRLNSINLKNESKTVQADVREVLRHLHAYLNGNEEFEEDLLTGYLGHALDENIKDSFTFDQISACYNAIVNERITGRGGFIK